MYSLNQRCFSRTYDRPFGVPSRNISFFVFVCIYLSNTKMLVFLEKLFFTFIPVHLLLSPFRKARLFARAYKLPVTTKTKYTGTIMKNANALKWNNDYAIFYCVRCQLISLCLPIFDERCYTTFKFVSCHVLCQMVG